ncbi:hypothetical protein HX878_22335 [Pseudomonas veronii]|uniref:hypothetical protein n=1 Tax=Pseudomonas veronii TaxID=76761 RepID=UPI0015A2692B|nr:hypothetical protein [Pseudomonas veronii]NWD57466.1 hypothetical protein [Pseudomonas veronii]
MSNDGKVRELILARIKRVYNTRSQLYKNIAYFFVGLAILALIGNGNGAIAVWGGGTVILAMVLIFGFPKWSFLEEYKNKTVPDAFLKELEESQVSSELKGMIAMAYAEDKELRFCDVLDIESSFDLAEKRRSGTGFQSLAKHIKRAD